jgi:uncharacterized protein (DUF302 family)
MLPCNIIIQEINDSDIEVAAIDPVASMMAVDNPELTGIAEEIKRSPKIVIKSISS